MTGRGRVASAEVRKALRQYMALQLASVVITAEGGHNGYGLRGEELEELRAALGAIKDGLYEATFELVRPDVVDSIIRELQARDVARKAFEARNDGAFVDFLYGKVTPRVGFKGNKKLRAEANALYQDKPDDSASV